MHFFNSIRRTSATCVETLKSGWRNPILVLLIGALAALSGLTLLWFTRPVYSDGRWAPPKQNLQAPLDLHDFQYPFLAHGKTSDTLITFHMKLGRIHPTRFVAHVLDRITFIEVNSEIVVALANPVPPYDQVTVDFGPWLHEGDNLIRVRMVNHWRDAYFYLTPSLGDTWLLNLVILALCSLACALRYLQLIRPSWLENHEAFLLFGALALRLIYLCGTPCSLRSYDWEDHLIYVRFIADHLALPPFNFGWETYQPPFFYAIFGLLGCAVFALGGTYDLALIIWQLASFVISGLTLLVALGLGRLLFPGPRNPCRLWFLGLLASIPGFVFFSSRITNDVLLALLSFAFLWAFLSFWQTHHARTWLVASGLCALGLLTKSTFLVFIPVVATSLFFAVGFSWREKTRLFAIFLAVIAVLAGWFLVKRALESHSATSFVVASSGALDPSQNITPTFVKLLTFNPIELVKQPFAWVVSHPRRDIFPEFFLRTALFSEAHPNGYLVLGRTLVICTLLLLLYFFWGLWTSLRSTSSPTWPLLVTLLAFIAAQIVYVLIQPFACNQNFRFSIILLVPLFYFIIAGIAASPPRIRSAGQMICSIFIALSVLYTLIQRGVLA